MTEPEQTVPEPSQAAAEARSDVPEEPTGIRSIPPVVWSAVAIFGLLLVFWTILAPAYRSPDESQHVNSVLRIASGGGWPEPGQARMSDQVMASRTLIGFTRTDDQRGNWDGGNLLPGVRKTLPESDLKYFALYSNMTPTTAEQRLPYDELGTGKLLGDRIDQMTQHPPLYYAVQAGIYKLLGADDWRFDRAFALMRLVSVAMVFTLPLMAYLTTRRLTGSRHLGSVAAFVPLMVPQLAHIGSSVTNDALVIGLGGLAMTLLAYLVTGAASWRLVGSIGVVLGLACLTKGTLLPMVPAAAIAMFVALWRGPDGGRRTSFAMVRTLVAMGIAFVIGGWWYVVNLVRYQTIVPSGLALPVQEGADRMGVVEFAGTFTAKLSASFWGNFGLLELPLPEVLTWVLTVLGIGLVVLGLARSGTRRNVGLLLIFPIVTVLYLFYSTFELHQTYGSLPGIQGRYLFGAIVPLAAAVAIGVSGRASRRWILPLTVAVSLAISAYGVFDAFVGFYLDVGWTISMAGARMLAWNPWPQWSVFALVGVLAAVALAALVLAVLRGNQRGVTSPPVESSAAEPLPG